MRMKKRFLIQLAVFAAALVAAFSACSVREDIPQDAEEEGVMLRFFCDEDFQVKATSPKDGETALNENVLATVDFFLYPEGKTDENAIYHERLSNVSPSTWNTISLSTAFVTGVLCPNKAKTFRVYAIANYPSDIVSGNNLNNTSVPVLEALTRDLETEAGDIKCPQTNFLMSTDGAFQVTGVNTRVSMVAKGDVKLKRVAAKVSIVIRVEDEVVVPNKVTINNVEYSRQEKWTPRTDEMEIYLVNGTSRGQVSGQPLVSNSGSLLFTYQSLDIDDSKSEQHNYSKYTLRTNNNGDPVDENGNVINEQNDKDYIYDLSTLEGTFHPSEFPFYTYPQTWEYGSTEEPYLKLMIPWDREAGVDSGGNRYGALSKNYYYRVYCPGTPIDGTHAQFLRNNWYKVILNVSILGSENDGGILNIEGSYYIVDWQEKNNGSGSGSTAGGTDTDKEAEIKGARYLFLNHEEYWLYNVEELTVPYITSDVCAITGFSASRNLFNGSSKTSESITNAADWGMSLETVSTASGAHFVFEHPLNNDTTTDTYDVSEYTIHFTLYQIGQSTTGAYAKHVTIHQYPAIMIDMEKNDVSTQPYGAYVNNGTVSGDNPTWSLGSVPGSGSSSNNNYNMILIETTVLPADSPYMLGDPRTSYVDNLNFSRSGNTYTDNWPTVTGVNRSDPDTRWSVQAPSIQNTNRRLSYYHPAIPGEEANNVIAPKFRIASSRGATQPMTYANAFRRCASYQEYGYPAGRWRLPTVAEIQYIAKLNADGKIERLLGGDTITYTQNGRQYSRSDTWQASKEDSDCHTEYWCNSGYMLVYDGKKSNWVQNNNGVIPPPEIGTGDKTGNKYVRCVYDDWYWDGMKSGNTSVSTVGKTTFTWGDMQ